MELVAQLFVLGSILGWLLEVIYRSSRNRRFINPGALMGPYLPIYGFGAVMVLAGHLLLPPSGWWLKAVVYCIGVGSLEYSTGWLFNKVFQVRLWDYRNNRLTVDGHVCLQFLLYWTALALILDYSFGQYLPSLRTAIGSVAPVSDYLFLTVVVLMTVDFFVSKYRRIKLRIDSEIEKRSLHREFIRLSRDILALSEVKKLHSIDHHAGKNRLDHMLDVAWSSFLLSKVFGLDSQPVVRGALLHDLFDYDWRRGGPRWHAVRHPGIALRNASKIVSLTDKERDIISKHMWPLTLGLPRYWESLAVCVSDILCSWRDYLVAWPLTLLGRHEQWVRRSASTFPSFAYIERSTSPATSRTSLSILLVDVQPRELPYSALKTLTLPRVAGATPPQHQVRIEDGRVEKITIPEDGTDLIGMTFSCNNARRAYRLADEAGARGILTVAGGPHATAMPEEVLEHFDSVVVGEAEGGAWEQLLADAQRGQLGKVYRSATPPDLVTLGPPRLDLLRSKSYLPVDPVEATRGCPNRCSFCFNQCIHPTFRTRPIAQVVDDVCRAEHRDIFFMDDNLFGDPEYAKELFRSLRPLGKRLYFQTQLSAARDEELVALAAEAGCRAVFVGLESVNPASLDGVDKTFNQVGRFKEQIAVLDDHGILVVGGLILGLDGDGPGVSKQTMDLLQDTAICSVAVNLVIPYPGTVFHRRMVEDGRVRDQDYENYTGYKLIVRPKNMDCQVLEREYEDFVRDFYSLGNVLRRFRRQGRPLRELPSYGLANIALRVPRQVRSRSLLGSIYGS